MGTKNREEEWGVVQATSSHVTCACQMGIGIKKDDIQSYA